MINFQFVIKVGRPEISPKAVESFPLWTPIQEKACVCYGSKASSETGLELLHSQLQGPALQQI